MTQVHTRFSDHQAKELIERYIHHEIERTYIQEMLGIGKSRFFMLLQIYREDPDGFSVAYTRHKKTRSIAPIIEGHILEELAVDKTLIDDPDVPIRRYNYSYIKDRLESTYRERVSLPTIINRAKKNGFYRKHSRKAIHDREVMTRYVGELIQHDASFHLWSPPAQKKWYLIASLDDYSRFILYAAFLEKETSMAHIASLESVFLRYGMPFSYYVDSHSIFRFVRGRDSFWQKHLSLTDEATPQWKQILDNCNVKVTNALSPQAKGKINVKFF